MPTYEDIFLLKLLWEEGLVSCKDLETPLRAFYQEGSSGRAVSLADICERYRVVSHENLSRLRDKIASIVQPHAREALPVYSLKECQRLGMLGKSSLGTTYRVNHPQLGICALKCFEGTIAKNRKFVQRFLQQLERGRRIVHTNVASIYLVDQQNQAILRELCPGESLEDRLLRGMVAAEEATHIILQACCGLEEASKVGLLHKNLKPSNILIGEDGNVKVADFSLPPTIPYYLSPEQCQKHKSDVRSDIYSLGIIFYQMLAGALPFSAKSSREVMEEHIVKEYTPLREKNPKLPPSLVYIVDRMVAKNPDKRYHSLTNLIADLRKVVPAATTGKAEKSNRETPPVTETAGGEEDKLMYTAMMATVTPSVDVLRHNRAKIVAHRIVDDWSAANAAKIQEACQQGNFYDALKELIAQLREQYRLALLPMSAAEMPYVDEALEHLRKKSSTQMEQGAGAKAEAPKLTFRSIPPKEYSMAEVKPAPAPVDTGEPALEALAAEEEHSMGEPLETASFAFANPPSLSEPYSQEVQEAAMEAVVAEEEPAVSAEAVAAEEEPAVDAQSAVTAEIPANDVPPATENTAMPAMENPAGEYSAEPLAAEPASMDQVETAASVSQEPLAQARSEAALEAEAVEDRQSQPAIDVPEVAADKTEASRQADSEKSRLPKPTEIPISSKAIPMPKAGDYASASPAVDEEWGPGLRGDTPAPATGSIGLFKKANKLVPYFKKDTQDKKE